MFLPQLRIGHKKEKMKHMMHHLVELQKNNLKEQRLFINDQNQK